MEVKENQTMTVTQRLIGGTFTCTVGGRTTRAIPFDASIEEVNAALDEIRSPVILKAPATVET